MQATPENVALAWPIILGYIGPGAGFAFFGSFLILFVALVLALFAALTFPLRTIIRIVKTAGRSRPWLVKRVVIVGMDGLDPRRVRALMERKALPNFQKLAAEGTFSELTTTCPPISPVAWSSFQTGVNPGKHNIFDFLNRDLRTCMPELSSCRTRIKKNRGIRGRERATVTLLRKSKPFWEVLAEHGVFSTVLRVPVTYPPQKFDGLLLSGMCVPDIRGSQGTFTVYENGPATQAETNPTGGERIRVEAGTTRISTWLPGPTVGTKKLNARLLIEFVRDPDQVVAYIGNRKIRLNEGVYSPWIVVRFGRGLRAISGICRFLLCSVKPVFRLYVTPINIAPQQPVLPISHPRYYSIYLAKLLGPYATLGVAEDTWALNEGVIDEAAYLRQAWDIQQEREKMFFEALQRTRTGVCCCVFDLPDRVQHMFLGRECSVRAGTGEDHQDRASARVDEAYRHMDRLIGTILEKLDKNTVLLIVSDHGFAPFSRGINLNVWLKQEGYLVEKTSGGCAEYLQNVEWSRTKAYAFGLAGIYLNLKGREKPGILTEAEYHAAKREIIGKLTGLRDPATGQVAILAVHDAEEVYRGPYIANGPDLIVGYAPGYRASWEAAVGRTDGPLFTDNTRHWSGDHCVDFSVVPGVFASNRRMQSPRGKPHITDVAPTVLHLFGIPRPVHMDGEVMEINTS
ncbi:MAG: alkaline phosphatase family protein [Kiritimatiellae bacterium]|nr:alkaline phosphatase family protein [Kiritimatiellia bacterium]